MPCLHVRINAPLSAEEKDAVSAALSKIVSQQLGKPESYVMVLVEDNVHMRFAGTTDKCVFMDLRSIGCISRGQNKKTSAALTKFWTDKGFSSDRTYISFMDMPGANWGYDGDTFG